MAPWQPCRFILQLYGLYQRYVLLTYQLIKLSLYDFCLLIGIRVYSKEVGYEAIWQRIVRHEPRKRRMRKDEMFQEELLVAFPCYESQL